MWMPGISALLTCRILRRPLSTLGWTWNWRYVLIGYLIPIIYCLAASLGIWIFGFGGFPNTDAAHQAAEAPGLAGAPDWVVIAVFVVVPGTAGMVTGVGAAAVRRSAGVAFWCRNWPMCSRSRVWRCCRE